MGKHQGMLRLAEVERRLQVSRWTLYEWLKEGKIRGVKLPCGHYRIPVDEVTRLITKAKVGRTDDDI